MADARDETPTLIQVITSLRPFSPVWDEKEQKFSERRPLDLDEEVKVPRWVAEFMRKNRHVAILGR